jgi:hypothetical protein
VAIGSNPISRASSEPACVDAFLARWDDVTTVATTQNAKPLQPLQIPATAMDIPDKRVPDLCLPM